MKLPSEVKILNHHYTVMEVDEIKDDSLENGDCLLGLLDDTKLQILVIKSLSPSRKYQIFLHEVTHALFNIIDFRRYLKDPETEESVVNFISDILLQVLTDNDFKFPKKYKKLALEDDKELSDVVLDNHRKGVSIKDICNTFQVEAKEVKKLLVDKLEVSDTKKKKKTRKIKK